MKILVTGSAGFIGFHLTRRLAERGDDLVGIDSINDYYDVSLKYARLAENGIQPGNAEKWNIPVKSGVFPSFKFLRMKLEDTSSIERLFQTEKFDKVVNLAAQAGVRYSLENPMAYIDSNIVGFMNILESCRHNRVNHLVYASSSSVYGSNLKMPFSESDQVDHPLSLYAATKKANELMAHTYSHLYGLPTTGLRFFTVYGPWGRPDMALFKFMEAIQADRAIDVYNDGNMKRDFTYVGDIVEGLIRVIDLVPEQAGSLVERAAGRRIDADAPSRIFNIGHGSPVQLMEYIGELEKNLGKKAKFRMLPMQPGDVPETSADTSQLYKATGYRPQVGIAEGVARFVEWYRDFYGR